MPVYYLDGVVLIGLGERVLFMVFIFYFFWLRLTACGILVP